MMPNTENRQSGRRGYAAKWPTVITRTSPESGLYEVGIHDADPVPVRTTEHPFRTIRQSVRLRCRKEFATYDEAEAYHNSLMNTQGA